MRSLHLAEKPAYRTAPAKSHLQQVRAFGKSKLTKTSFFMRPVQATLARWAHLCKHGNNEGTCPYYQSGSLDSWCIRSLLVWLHLDCRLWRRCSIRDV